MTGKFLTSESIIQQTELPGIWTPLYNQLWMHEDGTIDLCPRFENFDGYTIPACLHSLAGSNFEWDTRACRQHDLNCKYHQNIRVLLTEEELREKGFLHTDVLEEVEITVCENIPLEFLEITPISFKETNDKFLNMMKALDMIPEWRAKTMRFAVNFNIGWVLNPKRTLDTENLYVYSDSIKRIYVR